LLQWETQYAVVKLVGGNVNGHLEFSQTAPDATVVITGWINGTGLNQSLYHGLHIHKYGDMSNGCISMGEHFNPTSKAHGQHVGDLGSVNCTDPTASPFPVNVTGSKASLFYGGTFVMGRGVVLHALEDDQVDDSSAGSKIACGVIASESTPTTPTTTTPTTSGTSTTPTTTTPTTSGTSDK